MSRNIFYLIPIILSFFLGFACHRTPEQVETPPISRAGDNEVILTNLALQNIKIVRATVQDFPDRLNLMGRISVAEDRMTVVPSRVGGRIETVNIASVESVLKGQILSVLFSADFVSAREEYLQSMKQVNRVKDKSQNSEESGDFQTLSAMAKRKLETMGLTAEDISRIVTDNKAPGNMNVRAPRNGVIIDKKAIVGNLVNVGDTLFTIADLSKVWFSGDLYPEDIPKVHKEQKITIDFSNGGQPHSEKPIFGKVSFISPVVDPTARTIKIRALMENSNSALKADMFVQGSLVLSEKKALLIPSQAVLHLQDTSFVFTKIEPNKFKKTVIQIANEERGEVAVASGLKDGDSVVSDGALLLNAALNSNGLSP